MSDAEQPAVVVTGASTGIGEACCEKLIEAGYFVFGAVRRAEDADRLSARLGPGFAPLLFDVTDGAAVLVAAGQVERRLEGRALAALVNNAGVALPGPLLYQPIEEFQRQFEVNVFGSLRVVQAFAPLLGAGAGRAGPPGRIVQMSSVAGSLASPFIGAYCASKFALEGLSDALRRELTIFGVDVVVIEPGVIRTPIWDKAAAVHTNRYDATIYGPAVRRFEKWALEQGRSGPPPQLVADAVLRALSAPRPPARIVVVPRRFLDFTLPRLIPARVLDWLIARRLGFLDARANPLPVNGESEG